MVLIRTFTGLSGSQWVYREGGGYVVSKGLLPRRGGTRGSRPARPVTSPATRVEASSRQEDMTLYNCIGKMSRLNLKDSILIVSENDAGICKVLCRGPG